MSNNDNKVVLITANDDIVLENKDKQKPSNKKEKIIIVVLVVVFLIVLCGAFWDLYGRKTLTEYLCAPQDTTGTAGQVDESATKDLSATPQNTEAQGLPTTSPQGDKKGSVSTPTKPAGNTSSAASTPSNNVSYSSYGTCIENAKDLGSSKDCCDCLSADVSVRKACRDFAATYDFTKNTTIKTFTIPSTLGRTGNYSAYTSSATQQECKQKCDSSATLQCGDFQFCRTACDNITQ